MPPTVRTQAQLDSLFVDNDFGEISAGDGRDLIATVFGYAATFDPTNQNDSLDSAGIGAFFAVGSRWTNTTSQRVWECFSGTPHLAIWHAVMYLGDPTPANLTVRESDTVPTLPLIGVLTLNQSTGFIVAAGADGEAVVSMAAASAIQMGAVTTAGQTFAGVKTFGTGTYKAVIDPTNGVGSLVLGTNTYQITFNAVNGTATFGPGIYLDGGNAYVTASGSGGLSGIISAASSSGSTQIAERLIRMNGSGLYFDMTGVHGAASPGVPSSEWTFNVDAILSCLGNKGQTTTALGLVFTGGLLTGGSGSAGVTSVSGTAPIVSSGGTTPTLSITFGTAANTACVGNDARLSDARPPTASSITPAMLAGSGLSYIGTWGGFPL